MRFLTIRAACLLYNLGVGEPYFPKLKREKVSFSEKLQYCLLKFGPFIC